MRKMLILAVPAVALVVAAAALGQADRAARSVSPGVAAKAQIACGNSRVIGEALPLTGLAASLGQQQIGWADYYARAYNRTHRKKISLVRGDTQLPDTAQAIQVAERFASNSRMLAVVGPAGSQEVQVSTAPFRSGGIANISPSATRTSLTDGSRRGFFWRVVPNDDQQGPRVANYIRRTLKARRVVVVDAQNSYSTGLSDTVERLLRNAGLTVARESVSEATVTDFGSLVARIPSNTQVVYIPWQLAPKAQLFGRQLRTAGKRAVLFGSDGLFDPDNFKIAGSFISFFPIDLKSKVITAYAKSHGGKKDLFGLPAYVATQVATEAIDRACKDNQATRAEVRRQLARTSIPKARSLLGFKTGFFTNDPSGPQGYGDLRNPANFGIYKISNRGVYNRVS